VRLEGLGYRLADGRPLLCQVELRLERGQCGLLTGETGSGKSTLLRAIAGVLPGRVTGRAAVRGRAVLLLQGVETQLLFSLVEEEVASGLPRHLAARGERVGELLSRVGLSGFERRTLDALSAGEKQRVALAALLACEPAVLLLDEPTSALDAAGRQRLSALLRSLKARGHTLLVADHRTLPFRPLADRHFRMKEGTLVECALPPEEGPRLPPRTPAPEASAPVRVRCRGLGVRGADGRALIAGLSFRVASGERLLLCGPNGSGKSTLLRAIAGLVAPTAGAVRVDLGRDAGRPGAIGLLFQDPQRNLFERCVADEVAFSLRRRGLGAAACERRVEETLALCGLGPVRDRSPLRLSFGEQHRVALASILAPEPALLLLDEPFSGLDREGRERLLEIVGREQQRTGAALVLASHDREPLADWAHRSIDLGAEACHA
jgi:energy-coupling factor transport system ATP-binding protein